MKKDVEIKSSADWPTCDYCSDRFPTVAMKERHERARHADLLEELRSLKEWLLSVRCLR